MSAWITNRGPTEADADDVDCIAIPSPLSENRSISIPLANYKEGQPWRHTHRPRKRRKQECQLIDQQSIRIAAIELYPRRFASISRTAWIDQGGSQCHTLDAIADDGTAWWMVPGETGWQQLPALPDREASAYA